MLFSYEAFCPTNATSVQPIFLAASKIRIVSRVIVPMMIVSHSAFRRRNIAAVNSVSVGWCDVAAAICMPIASS